MIKLKKLDKNNYLDCITLELLPEQKHNLASNAITIAQSKYETHYRLRAIYKGKKVIGFLAFCHEDEPEDRELYWLFRFMIDKKYQGKGYASDALSLLVNEVKEIGGKRLHTMHKPSNLNAKHTYRNFGFKEIGVLDDGDTLLELILSI